MIQCFRESEVGVVLQGVVEMGMSLNKDFDEWREYRYVRGMPRILLAGAWHAKVPRHTDEWHRGTVQSEQGRREGGR